MTQAQPTIRRPHWLKVKLPGGANFLTVNNLIKDNKLNTVCQSAHCPNIGECWERRTATFMILGDLCSRNCGFCAVTPGKTLPLNPDEPALVAKAVKELELRYVVITSVTRDDLADGGAGQFAQVISAVREMQPGCKIEVLIPDFKGDTAALKTVIAAQPDLLNHNLETVPRLYKTVRPQALYQRSLKLLAQASDLGAVTKSGIMVGLGEEISEIKATMRDLIEVNCRMLTIGQYLPPSRSHLPVARFYQPLEFEQLKIIGKRVGFVQVEAGPLVRSSYHADEQFYAKDKL